MVGPTPSAAASRDSSASRIAVIDPNSAASARAAVGPTWRIDSPTSTRHSGRSLAASRLSRSLRPLADRTGPSPSPFFAARVKSGARSRSSSVEAEHVALVGDHAGVEKRHRGLVAESLDVERAAPRDVEHALAHLRGAALVVGAAEVLVALLLLRPAWCRRPRRSVGIFQRAQALGPQREHRARGSPGSRRRPCGGRRCRRDGHPCASPRGRCAGWRSRPSSPATLVGSITPYGVTRPVRPVLTRISSSLALTSSGGYLNAIAHRGAREVEPEPALQGRPRRP